MDDGSRVGEVVHQGAGRPSRASTPRTCPGFRRSRSRAQRCLGSVDPVEGESARGDPPRLRGLGGGAGASRRGGILGVIHPEVPNPACGQQPSFRCTEAVIRAVGPAVRTLPSTRERRPGGERRSGVERVCHRWPRSSLVPPWRSPIPIGDSVARTASRGVSNAGAQNRPRPGRGQSGDEHPR